jgi:hypothetical protein
MVICSVQVKSPLLLMHEYNSKRAIVVDGDILISDNDTDLFPQLQFPEGKPKT